MSKIPVMQATQSFRLLGTTHVEDILCDQVDGQNVIFWEEIDQVFPGVRHLKNGNVNVKMMRDSNHNRIEPLRIQHLPGVTLDVILSTTAGGAHTDSSLPNSSLPRVDPLAALSIDDEVEGLQVTPALVSLRIHDACTSTSTSIISNALLPSPSTTVKRTSQLSFREVVQLAQRKALESDIEQQLMASFSTEIQKQVRVSSVYGSMVQAIKDGQVEQSSQLITHFEELKTQMDKIVELTGRNTELLTDNNKMAAQMLEMQALLDSKQDEMNRMQVQALNQLALLHKQVQAVLTQTYELHEYPIPRLFVVLPQDQSRWDYVNPFANKFRLYFLCECGEHTKSTNSKIPHHIHLAKHDGYEIARPSEFFKQYGSYVLTILRMLKFGISVAGVVVPAVSNLFPSDSINQVTKELNALKGSIGTGIDQVINCIDKGPSEGGAIDKIMDPMENNEALEGADLRKLDTFLKNKDGNKVLGNLYRTVTGEGHVKWVCIDHYRENYQLKAVELFRDVVDSLNGSFDENTGRVQVTLYSRTQAGQFYSALETAKSVYELKIGLHWEQSYNDLRDLRNTLYKTNVGVLELSRMISTDSVGDLVNRNRQYDPIFDIMRHSPIISMAIAFAGIGLFTRSNLLSRNDDFSNLRHLEIDLSDVQEAASNMACILSKARNLVSLTLVIVNTYEILPIYNAIVEHQACGIVFRNQIDFRRTDPVDLSIYIPVPTRELLESRTTIQDLTQLFQDYGALIEELDVGYYLPEMSGMEALVKTSQSGSRLKVLVLRGRTRVGEERIRQLSRLVSCSEVRGLRVDMEIEDERVQIIQSIPWKHIRELTICLDQAQYPLAIMRALLDGMEKTIVERVELDNFKLFAPSGNSVLEDLSLLRLFISRTTLRELRLSISMDVSQVIDLISRMNVSRLETITLRTDRFDSIKVQSVLDSLQHAKKLKTVSLLNANITQEQIDGMKKQGVDLRSW
ncbi:hypothetical protein B0O80DRAFT_534570 [Mortierella sp. GBAus27b]|nr:hypothetical protein BGX31_010186 [Mortierella sp. GBA43]KAI8345107.1 hypothetical protein B0O80DRAFT_534570 [Mortierella sp. GBAus27b]